VHPPEGPQLDRERRSAQSTRRTFLRGMVGVVGAGVVGGLAAGSLTGCDAVTGGRDDEPHALDGFLAATVAMGDLYTDTITAQPALAPTLTPLRDAHQAHASALAGAMGREVPAAPATTAAPDPSDPTAARAALTAAESTGRDEAVTACLASAPRLAALLGSIAAARASHLEVLK